MDRRRVIGIMLSLLMVLVAAGCGQKPGVAERAVGPGGAIIDPETGQLIDPETGEVIGTADSTGAFGGGVGGGTSLAGSGGTGGSGGVGGGSTTGSGTSGGNNTSAAGPSGNNPGGRDPSSRPSGGTATGVTANTIKIGIHAPTTGAAPVPTTSFERGKDLYWNWLRSRGQSINGRNVVAVYRNDRYNPSAAVDGCQEMVEKEKVFLLVGVAGTDQIQACARYAASVGVPYISAGVTEIGFHGMRNYLAVWLSYKQQAPLLADLLVSDHRARSRKNAMVYFNTQNFYDARDSFVAAMRARGARVKLFPRSKTAGSSDAASLATELRLGGYQNVYVLTSPTYFIQLAQSGANQGYRPQYAGVGLSMGIDTVARAGCGGNRAIHGAEFLNPFPAYFNADRYDPNFRRAGGSDDIMFGLWGISKVIGAMLNRAGRNLTRERFVYFAERARGINTGVLPPVGFSPSDHFGGTTMHLNRANCSAGRWETVTSRPTRNF